MSNKKRSSRNSFEKVLLLILWGVLPIGLFLVVSYWCKQRTDQLMSLINEENASELLAYINMDSLLSAGLGILAMAVSVWIGLNIYNAITRKEIEESLQDNEAKINEALSESRKEIDDNLTELQWIIEQNKQENTESIQSSVQQLDSKTNQELQKVSKYLAFLNALAKNVESDQHGSGGYLYQSFSDLIQSGEFVGDEKDLDYTFLLRIENLYSRMESEYSGNSWDKVRLLADQMVHEISSRKTSLENRGVEMTRVEKEYLQARQAIATYYSIIVNKKEGYPEDERLLKDLQNTCGELLRSHGLSLERITYKLDSAGTDEKNFAAQFYSMFGYANHLCNYLLEDRDRTLLMLEAATSLNQDSAKYHHNLGVCMQRKWIDDCRSGKRSETQLSELFESTWEEFESATEKDAHDYKAYNDLGALALRAVDHAYINALHDEGKLYDEIASAIWNLPQEEKDAANAEIRKAMKYLKVAISLQPSFEDGYVNMGKACFYEWLFSGRHSDEMYEKAVEYCRIVETMSESSLGWKFVLRNILEVRPETLAEARVINDKLDGKGDAKDISESYAKRFLTNGAMK